MEIVYLYCVVSYLYSLGFFLAGYTEAKEHGMLLSAVFYLLAAPITNPIMLGWFKFELENNK